MNEAEKLAHEISQVTKRQHRLTRAIAMQTELLIETNERLCALHCEAAKMLNAAGHLGDDVTAQVIEPKR